jgi:hypothetical protein
MGEQKDLLRDIAPSSPDLPVYLFNDAVNSWRYLGLNDKTINHLWIRKEVDGIA